MTWFQHVFTKLLQQDLQWYNLNPVHLIIVSLGSNRLVLRSDTDDGTHPELCLEMNVVISMVQVDGSKYNLFIMN